MSSAPVPPLRAHPLEKQIRLNLARIIGQPASEVLDAEAADTPGTADADGIVRLTFETLAQAEAWKDARLAEMKWNLDRGRDADPNKARKAKKEARPYPASDARPQGKGGRKKIYQWTERWQCGHAQRYTDVRDPNLSPSKRLPNRQHASVKRDCGAYFWLRKKLDSEVTCIEYCPKHTGHEVGTLKEIASSMLTRRVRTWIDEQAEKGLDWPAIKAMLRIDNEILDQIEAGTFTEIPESLLIAQKDVYNAIRRQMAKVSRLDPDGHKSLAKWKMRLEAQGYNVIYEPVSAQYTGENSYIFGWVSPWQKQHWINAQISCLDSTHNTCFSATSKTEKAFLYTIVLKNQITGKGLPATFMITPSEAQYAISDWLRWLQNLGYESKLWMIDCSDMEAAAILRAIPDATIIVCIWHVMDAVCEQAKKKLFSPAHRGSRAKAATEANQKLRADAIADFKRLVRAGTPAEFDQILIEHEKKYAAQPDWIKYIANEWLSKKEQWCLAWRKGKARFDIDTNNYIESWHFYLKKNYLKLMRKQRIDVLLHILTDQVEPDLRRDEVRIRLNFEAPRLSQTEVESRRKADSILSAQATDMIEYCDDIDGKTPDMMVQSFTDAETWYIVKVVDYKHGNEEHSYIAGCNCPDFKAKLLKCKHMFLAARLTRLPLQVESLVQASRVTQPIPAAAVLPDAVRAEKEAARSRLLGEIDKMTRLANLIAKCDVDNVSRDSFMLLEEKATRLRRDMGEVAYGRPLYATQQ